MFEKLINFLQVFHSIESFELIASLYICHNTYHIDIQIINFIEFNKN